MSGSFSKQKGKRGEREVVDLFKAHGWDAVRLAPMQAGMLEGFPDVRAIAKLHAEIPHLDQFILMAEVKFRDRMPPLDDVLTEGKRHLVNCVFHRRTRKQMLITMDAEEFLKLLAPFISKHEWGTDGSSDSNSGEKVAGV